MCNTECSHTIDDDNVVHLLLGCVDERNGNAVAKTDVVDQDADVETVNQLLQVVIVGVLVLSKVHCVRLDRNLRSILGGYICRESIELRLCTRDEDEIVAFGSQGKSEFLSNAVRSTSNESPCSTRSECAQLEIVSKRSRLAVKICVSTYRFTRKNEQAQQNSHCADDGCCERRNTNKQEGIDCGLNEGIASIDVHTKQVTDGCHDVIQRQCLMLAAIHTHNAMQDPQMDDLAVNKSHRTPRRGSSGTGWR